jgi:hypothetical protein
MAGPSDPMADAAAKIVSGVLAGGGATGGYSPGVGAASGLTQAEQQDAMDVFFGRGKGYMAPVQDGDALYPGLSKMREGDDNVKSVSEAMAMFYEDDFDYKKLAEEAAKNGLKADTLDDLQNVWETAVQYSANKYAAGAKKTPWEMIPLMGGAWQGGGGEADRSRTMTQTMHEAGRTTTETATQVDISNPEQSRALVQDVLSRALGRRASGDELGEFVGTLNTYQRENPSVSTRTSVTTPQDTTQTTTEGPGGQSSSTTTAGGETSSSTTNRQGATAEGGQELLLENAMETPDYGAYQASTTYYNALLGALAAPV